MSSPLAALSSIISDGIKTIDSAYTSRGTTYPSLDEPFQPPTFDDREITQTANLVIAAAAQLIASLRNPVETLFDGGQAHFISGSLGVVADTGVAEVLTEGGSEGMHINEIGEKCGTDASKIGRVLRALATLHIFREVSPDVFANNRISSLLDTGKSIKVIKADPIGRYDETSGVTALIGHFGDEALKSSGWMVDNFRDLDTLSSQDTLAAPFNRALQTPYHFFEWYEQPGNEYRLKRFTAAMGGFTKAVKLDAVLDSLDWIGLKKDNVVVDVGGGIGETALALAKAHPHLHFIIQDRPSVIADGIKHWQAEYPEALADNRVHFQAHDFFGAQPIKDASVFFLRCITHDWSDGLVKKILTHLAQAAQPSTKLVLMENIVPYCSSTRDQFSHISGAEVSPSPYPLLANLGLANFQTMRMDLHMMAMHNGQERTVGQFIDVVKGTGWQLESISRVASNTMPTLVFTPAAL